MRMLKRRGLLVVVCLGFTAPVWAEKPDEKPKIKVEFRRAEAKAGEGLMEATIAGTNEKVYLHKATEATNADIASARAGEDANKKPIIEITFSKDGAKKMAALSEAQKDKRIAILIDGKVVSAPVVRAKFSARAQITGSFTKAEVEKMVKAINEK